MVPREQALRLSQGQCGLNVQGRPALPEGSRQSRSNLAKFAPSLGETQAKGLATCRENIFSVIYQISQKVSDNPEKKQQLTRILDDLATRVKQSSKRPSIEKLQSTEIRQIIVNRAFALSSPRFEQRSIPVKPAALPAPQAVNENKSWFNQLKNKIVVPSADTDHTKPSPIKPNPTKPPLTVEEEIAQEVHDVSIVEQENNPCDKLSVLQHELIQSDETAKKTADHRILVNHENAQHALKLDRIPALSRTDCFLAIEKIGREVEAQNASIKFIKKYILKGLENANAIEAPLTVQEKYSETIEYLGDNHYEIEKYQRHAHYSTEEIARLKDRITLLKRDLESESRSIYRNSPDQELDDHSHTRLSEIENESKLIDHQIEIIKSIESNIKNNKTDVNFISNIKEYLNLNLQSVMQVFSASCFLGLRDSVVSNCEKFNKIHNFNSWLRANLPCKKNRSISRFSIIKRTCTELTSNYLFRCAKEKGELFRYFDSKNSLIELTASLENENTSEYVNMVNFLSRDGGVSYVYKLAIANLLTAGFNTKTQKLDAPHLQYKIDSGFGWFKRNLSCGKKRSYTQDPTKHILPRIKAISAFSRVLEKNLFFGLGRKPRNFDYALTTSESLSEASALILAAIPSDVLVLKNEKVTEFLVNLKNFESQLKILKKENLPLDSAQRKELFEGFKRNVLKFHSDAGEWLYERNQIGSKASIKKASCFSERIEIKRQKRVVIKKFSRVSDRLKILRRKMVYNRTIAQEEALKDLEAVSTLKNLLLTQKNPRSVSEIKYKLNQFENLYKDTKDAAIAKANVEAILNFLNGKSHFVYLGGKISMELCEILIDVSDLLHERLELKPHYKGVSIPVLQVSLSQLSDIQSYSKNYPDKNLAMFLCAKGVPPERQEPKNVDPAIRDLSFNDVAEEVEFSDADEYFDDALDYLDDVAVDFHDAVDNLDNLPQPVLTASEQKKLDNWFIETCQEIFQEGPDNENEALSNYLLQNKSDLTIDQISKIRVDLRRDGKKISPETLANLKTLAPLLFTYDNGFSSLPKQRRSLIQMNDARLSGLKLVIPTSVGNRCLVRASWAAAASALPKDVFINKITQLSRESTPEIENQLTAQEARNIFEQVLRTPSEGCQNLPHLENKQIKLMIALVRKAQEDINYTVDDNVKKTLSEWVEGKNVLLDQEFANILMGKLGLPLVVHQKSSDVLNNPPIAPHVVFPPDYSLEGCGLSSTWPVIFYDAISKHWNVYLSNLDKE